MSALIANAFVIFASRKAKVNIKQKKSNENFEISSVNEENCIVAYVLMRRRS